MKSKGYDFSRCEMCVGIPSLKKIAIKKALDGIITLEEALRCTWT